MMISLLLPVNRYQLCYRPSNKEEDLFALYQEVLLLVYELLSLKLLETPAIQVAVASSELGADHFAAKQLLCA